MRTCLFLSAIALTALASADATVEGISFADRPGDLMVPLKELAAGFGWLVEFEPKKGTISLNGKPIEVEKRLMDGTALIPLSSLADYGVERVWDKDTRTATLHLQDKDLLVKWGEKRVLVDKARQVLEAYQGARLVMTTNVSTGRPGHNTPNGNFNAGPAKERIHFSHLYENAPMPWAVEVHGNVFIHGYGSVPYYPASHGCVRMPLNHGNPAKWFYHWVDLGTPVSIYGTYTWRQHHSRRHRRRRH